MFVQARSRAGAPQGGRGGGGVFAPITDVPYSDYTRLHEPVGRTNAQRVGRRERRLVDRQRRHPRRHDEDARPASPPLQRAECRDEDFDLKVEFKISATGANGGIQYRSRLLMAPHKGSIAEPARIADVARYHDVPRGGAGGRRRTRSCTSGGGGARERGNPQPAPPTPTQAGSRIHGRSAATSSTSIRTTASPVSSTKGRAVASSILLVGSSSSSPGGRTGSAPCNANPDAAVKPHNGLQGEWQQVQIVARGNTLVHVLNGQVITVTIDDDPASRAPQGILSLQLEGQRPDLVPKRVRETPRQLGRTALAGREIEI